MENNDNPIVALEPEEQAAQRSIDRSKKFKSVSQHPDTVEVDEGA